MAKKKPTVADVARISGVSRATVSRVVNATATVSPETEKLVRDAIEATGYVANVQAQALSRGRTDSMAALLTEPFDELYQDPTYSSMLRGIHKALAPTAIFPVLLQAYTEEERAKALKLIRSGVVDAVIHLSPFNDLEGLEALASIDIPVVLCGQVHDPDLSGPFACVYADDVAGAALAANHVKEIGPSTIGVVMGVETAPATIDRLKGFRQVLGDQVDARPIVFGDWGTTTGYRGVEELLQPGDVDMILCGSDRIAAGVVDALKARGFSVPGDVSVVGFDDHAIAVQNDPKLTTVAQPMVAQGEEAVRLALEMLKGAPPETTVLDMELKVRESTKEVGSH